MPRYAAVFEGGKMCRELNFDAAVAALREGPGLLWLHMEEPSVQADEVLRHRLALPPLEVEDAFSDQERPSLSSRDDGLFVVLPAPVGDAFVEVSAWIMPGGMITYAHTSVPAVKLAYDRWLAHPLRLGESPAMLLHGMMDAVIDGYFPLVDQLEDETEALMDRIFTGDVASVADVLSLKRRFLELRRRLAPARDVLNALLRRDVILITPEARPYFQDVFDHVLRLNELIEINRETLASLLDVHLGTVSNNLNTVMKNMTVYSLMLMAPAVVGGIYGMNFDRIPELHWAAGYPFALALMVLSSATIYGYFRWRGWVGV